MKLESNERGRRGIRKWRLGIGLEALALVCRSPCAAPASPR